MRPTTPRVVYLFGAGASYACLQAVNSPHEILMKHLVLELTENVRKLVTKKRSRYRSFEPLVNRITQAPESFEPVVTFLEASPSSLHQLFATRLRKIFAQVLRSRLAAAENELGDDRFSLYAALLDMYQLPGCPEHLQGFLTLNYDNFLDSAAQSIADRPIDFGIALRPPPEPTEKRPLPLIKLHGSFDWKGTWPVTRSNGKSGLWIPPGINKNKQNYPFTRLWGAARDLLDCQVLRIVGCQLSSTDWDLISLLFSTRQARPHHPPYTVEIIDRPRLALELQAKYPYLDIRSLPEIRTLGLGDHYVSELLRTDRPLPFKSLTEDERATVVDEAEHRDGNWFRVWLVLMAEALVRDSRVTSVETTTNAFSRYLGV